jgi:hypothetical protein
LNPARSSSSPTAHSGATRLAPQPTPETFVFSSKNSPYDVRMPTCGTRAFFTLGVLVACRESSVAAEPPVSGSPPRPATAPPSNAPSPPPPAPPARAAPPPSPPSAAALPVIRARTEALAHLGERVRVHGRPERTKLAASVVGDGFRVYCLGLDEFPPGREVGAVVVVEGVLQITDDHASRVDERGAVSQGTAGRDWVLRECRLVE